MRVTKPDLVIYFCAEANGKLDRSFQRTGCARPRHRRRLDQTMAIFGGSTLNRNNTRMLRLQVLPRSAPAQIQFLSIPNMISLLSGAGTRTRALMSFSSVSSRLSKADPPADISVAI